MAEPPDQTPAAAGRGHLRASHADREQVIGVLKAAFVQGRLAKDEFDLRVGRAFASRTYAELTALTADLPAGLAAAQLPPSTWAADEPRIPRPGLVLTVATVLYAGVWAYAILFPNGSMVVTKVWRSICGCALAIGTPAVSARCRSRRVAAWLSIRVPRALSRIGPRVRVPMAVDGPADRGRPRDQDDFGPFAAHAQHPVAVLFTQVGDVGADGFEDPQAEQAEHGHQGEIAAAG